MFICVYVLSSDETNGAKRKFQQKSVFEIYLKIGLLSKWFVNMTKCNKKIISRINYIVRARKRNTQDLILHVHKLQNK